MEGGRAGGGQGEGGKRGRGRGWGGRLGGEGGRHAIHLKSNPHVIKSTLIYHKAGGSLLFSALPKELSSFIIYRKIEVLTL